MTADINPTRCPYCVAGPAGALREMGCLPTEDCDVCGGTGKFRRRTGELSTVKSRRDAALVELRALAHASEEAGHRRADAILLELLADDEITAAFTTLPRWYA